MSKKWDVLKFIKKMEFNFLNTNEITLPQREVVFKNHYIFENHLYDKKRLS